MIDPGLIKRTEGRRGFSLLEITLVAVIIGIVLAVVIPRAQRARMDAKFTQVRQVAGELAKWGMVWAKRNLETQAPSGTVLKDYADTLLGFTGDAAATNWTGALINVNGAAPAPPLNSVEDIMPPEKPINPFNGANYFNNANSGASLSEGQLKLVLYNQSYYFIFVGPDPGATNPYYSPQGDPAAGGDPQTGVFMVTLQP